jgi:VCBS repeat-containing protein
MMTINYAPWAVPIVGKGLGCVPQFDLQQIQTCPAPTGDNLPPVASGIISFVTTAGAIAAADLKTFVTDPESDTLTFAALSMYGTKHGKLTFRSNGTFDYALTDASYTGYDNFFFTVSDGVNPAVTMEAIIRVTAATPVPTNGTPSIRIDTSRATVHQYMYMLTFPIEVSPAAQPCEIWRLTIRQSALDCDCNCYYNVSCYDIVVGKCR